MTDSPKPGSNRQAILAVVAVALLVVAAVIVAKQQTNAVSSNQVWYYDLADGSLFAGEPEQILPIAAPSGPDNGVLATVYACGQCTPETRQILYLESNTPEAKEILQTMPDPAEVDASSYIMKAQEGQLIAALPAAGEQPNWFSAFHPDAETLRGRTRNLCDVGTKPIRCTP